MKITLLFASVIGLSLGLGASASFAQQPPKTGIPKQDVMLTMLGSYYDRFQGIPPARKCVRTDVQGMWVETAIWEIGGNRSDDQQKNGKEYLAFDLKHQRFLSKRSPLEPRKQELEGVLNYSQRQFIATDDGMLYVYDAGELTESLLCFVTTEDTRQFKKDAVLLARPIEKDTPLAITLYQPFRK